MIRIRKPGRKRAALALMLFAFATAIGQAQILRVPQKNQERDQWCWAGCSQAILDYYGATETQTEIAQYGTGGANVWNYCYGEGTDADGIYRRGIDLILDHFGHIQCTTHNASISFTTSQAEISAGRPVLVNWQWDTGGGHFVVLRGLDGATASLMDPWNGPTINTFAWTERGGGHTWEYSLRVTTDHGDAYEPDGTRTRARKISNSQTQARSLLPEGDVDWAKFTVNRYGAARVRISTSGTDGDTQMTVWRASDGSSVGSNDDFGTSTFARVSIPYLAPGVYQIEVRGYRGVPVDAYALRAVWYPGDRYERDNVSSAAKEIANGETQARNIHAAGNRDWAKFLIGPAGARNVRIQTAGAAGDTKLSLYAQNTTGTGAGRRIASDNDGGIGKFSRIAIPFLTEGVYYIRIQENGNNAKIPAYTLRTRWATP